MCVRDPSYRDAFAARAHPSVVFGPSEMVPGGYVCYADGRLKDLTNVVVTSLETHDLTWVKGNIDSWEEPAGVQQPLRPGAHDPSHAGDPSVYVPRVRRAPLAEAAAPEEEMDQQPLDRPGDAPGDFWLEPFNAEEEENELDTREGNFINKAMAPSSADRCRQPGAREPKRSRRRQRDREFARTSMGFNKPASFSHLWCPHSIFTLGAEEFHEENAIDADPAPENSAIEVEGENTIEVNTNADVGTDPNPDADSPSSVRLSPTLSPVSYDHLSFSDFEDDFVVGAYTAPGEYFEVDNRDQQMTVETPIGDATRDSQDSKDATIDVDSDSDDDPLHRRGAAGSGQAEGASKRQRGSSTRRGKVSPQEKVPKKSRSRSVRDGGRRR